MIAWYVHPKNSNHLRSHLRAIITPDPSRLGMENKSGQIFCVRQLQNLTKLETCKPTFHTFYTSSEVKQYHEALFLSYRPRTDHNFNAIQIALIQYSGLSKHPWAFTESGPLKKIPKSPIRLAGSHFWQAPKSTVKSRLIELYASTW